MLRRQARLRREYLYRKSVEDKHKQLQEKKDRLKRSLEEGIPIHGDLRREALALQDKLRWTDEGKALKTGNSTNSKIYTRPSIHCQNN